MVTDDELTAQQGSALKAIYAVLRSTGGWPTFQHLASVAWSDLKTDPNELFFQLSDLSLVRPQISRDRSFQLREDLTVSLSIRGLAEIPEAQGDVERFVACVRYLAEQARVFKPPDPTAVASLEVKSDDVAEGLGLSLDDSGILRLGRLLQEASPLWTAFGSSQQGWKLTLNLAEARRYIDIRSIDDYVALAESAPGSGSPAPEAPGQGSSVAISTGGSSVDGPVADIGDSDAGTPHDAGAETASVAAERSDSAAAVGTGDENPTPERKPRPKTERLRFATNVTADLPTTEDLLGFRPVVNALHGLLNDASTVLPLAIAITAPWGAGKSSVMSQLANALANPPEGVAQPRTWATVRFDAWKYENGERLWAALAKAIYGQSQIHMTRWQRLVFRMRLELRRRGPLGSLLTLAWPCVVIAAIAIAAISINVSGIGTFPAVAVAAAVALGTLKRYGDAIVNPFRFAIERHAHRPDYEARLGFTAEADNDISLLMRLTAPDERHGLAVFVDDLDRCSSAHLVEVVEAMNQIFNSTSEHRCVFVLGLDRDVVASNINVAYASTVAQLKEDGSSLADRFGLEFLAKLVQLTVALPEPTQLALQALLEKITGNSATAPETRPSDDEVARVQADIQSTSGPTLASVRDAAARIITAPAQVVEEAVRRERAERIEDSYEVAAAEFAALRWLERNPRQVKRFHNAFRLQLYVANEDDRVPFDFTESELVSLAKWVVVRLRWPDLGNAIAQQPDLLIAMEAAANDEPSSLPDVLKPDRTAARDLWLARKGVRAVMAERDKSLRMSSLELKDFLRVA